MNKKKVLNSEFGTELLETVKQLNLYLYYLDNLSNTDEENRMYLVERIDLCNIKLYIMQTAIRSFLGTNYEFIRTNEYYGLYDTKRNDWLIFRNWNDTNSRQKRRNLRKA